MVFLRKGVLMTCSKFTEENPCRSEISIKLLCKFTEFTFRHAPVNLLHIFRTSLENISLEGDKASRSFWKTDQPASYQCSFYFTTLQFSVAIAVKYWKTQEQMGALARNWFNMWPFISTKISKQMGTLAGNRLRDRLPI